MSDLIERLLYAGEYQASLTGHGPLLQEAAARIRTTTLAAAKGDILNHPFLADRNTTEALLPEYNAT